MVRLAVAAVLLAVAPAALSGCAGTPAPVSGERCLEELNAHAITYHPVDIDNQKDWRCQVDTAVRVSRVEVPLSNPVTISCLLTTRLDTFERDVVAKLAAADLGERVSRINHLGAYSCRTGPRDRLSQHAYGLAIDISGFQLTDGSSVSVEHDWWAPGPKRTFLHHLAKSACGYFSVVLTPSSNREHFNHMHFDIGPDRLCSV